MPVRTVLLAAILLAFPLAARSFAQAGRRGAANPGPFEWLFGPLGGSQAVNDYGLIALSIVVLIVGLSLIAIFRRRAEVDSPAEEFGVVNIQVFAPPPGQAPLEIRRAWVGVVMPISTAPNAEPPEPVVGKISGQLLDVEPGYAVDAPVAIERLAAVAPEAAEWWRKHARRLIAPGRRLFFPADVARMVTADETIAGDRVSFEVVEDGAQKKCGRCGELTRVYAVRCRQCKGVFAAGCDSDG
ncbi:MAG TPA: hypothetical protein VGE52_03285 [Pirellulales bacterium]